MGKTFREYRGDYFRSPRGYKRALVEGERVVPPNAWDDIRFSRESCSPERVAVRMLRRGCTVERVRRTLCGRFGLSTEVALRLLSCAQYHV